MEKYIEVKSVNTEHCWNVDNQFVCAGFSDKNKTKWGSQVQGSFRKLSEHDYNVIANEIRKRIENE